LGTRGQKQHPRGHAVFQGEGENAVTDFELF